MRRLLGEVLSEKGGQVFHVSPTATVIQAVHLMNEKAIGAVLVIDSDKLIGIFSERDVLRRVLDGHRSADETQVCEVMSSPVITITKGKSVQEAMAVMTEKRCRHLPVVDGNDVAGMISIGDLTRWVTLDQAHEIEELVDYITGKYPG